MNSLLKTRIRQLCKEKNAVVLAHYYTEGDVQDVADFVGDSLALAQWAAKTRADIIVMCGVNFMGETCKILCPTKKVLVPDNTAGCSLADSCEANALRELKEKHPDYKVVSYVNTTAAVKALTDVVVTSSNARQIVESFPKDEKLIFGPDRNLGGYINEVTGRNMLLWQGGCHVHSGFDVDEISRLKREHPNAKVLVHPECPKEIQRLADKVGSTAELLAYSVEEDSQEYIVGTESGVIYEMQRRSPKKTFYAVGGPCEYMKLNTLEKVCEVLRRESPEVMVDKDVAEAALKPIQRMLELS